MHTWVARHRISAPLRVLVAALCLLFAAAPTLPGLHFLLVAHVICPQHGELLHAASAAEELPGHTSAAAPNTAHTRELAWVAAPAPGHDACGVPAWGNTSGAACGGPAAQGVERVPFVHGRSGSAPVGHTAIALLSYAPKLAPPCPSGLAS
jgi:hypothetical protein